MMLRHVENNVEHVMSAITDKGKAMELRKLEKKEHKLTRHLWEAVFSEDSKKFLDYYYQAKIEENIIYVIEEENEIRAMLHLNPYEVYMDENLYELHYIVAVATEEAYRGRGMMRQLLVHALKEMYGEKEPFTFLMPAAEAIYRPYDFRFVFRQAQMKITGEDLGVLYEMKEASQKDTQELAELARTVLKDCYQIYVKRTVSYYEKLLLEQQSENGGIKKLYQGGILVGIFAYEQDSQIYIREPLVKKGFEKVFVQAVFDFIKGKQNDVKCIGITQNLQDEIQKHQTIIEKKPMIMARIVHLESFLRNLKIKENQNFECSFAIIDPLISQNNRIVNMRYCNDKKKMEIRETENSDGVITIDAFTSFIFGYCSIDEIALEEGVILSESLKEEFSKIKQLNHVFLNEVV